MTNTSPSRVETRELLDAFELFTRASESLEGIHGQLLRQIEHLSVKLEAANHRLRESLCETEAMRNELLHVLECQPNGVLVVDLSGRVLHANGRFGELLGIRTIESSQTIVNVVTGAFREFVTAYLGHALHLETRCLEYPVEKTSACRYLQVSASPMKTADGVTSAAIFVIHDQTTQRQLENENRKKERLAAMGAMAAQLAHEIRNPLNSIGLYVSLIEDHVAGNGPAEKWCRQIQSAIQVLNTLVCNMLNLASPAEPRWTPLPIEDALDSVLEFSASLLDSNAVTLEKVWGAAGQEIHADPELMRQLLLNLILNAVQAMPTGGVLRIETRFTPVPDNGFVEVLLSDSGEGIDKQNLTRLFEPGFSMKEGGHGLGLWIVGHIVEKHQGSIRVSSEPGCGTEFRIRFPVPRRSREKA